MASALEDLDTDLQKIISEVASNATWRRDYSGGPHGILGGINDAIRRAAAYKIAIDYGLQHGVAPKGRHGITMSVGPVGSDADYTNSYISRRYHTTVEIDFSPPIKEDLSKLNWDKKKANSFNLGPVDIDLSPGYSFASNFWIELIAPDKWRISMLAEETDDDGDPIVEVIDDFSLEDAQKYLQSYGIRFDP